MPIEIRDGAFERWGRPVVVRYDAPVRRVLIVIACGVAVAAGCGFDGVANGDRDGGAALEGGRLADGAPDPNFPIGEGGADGAAEGAPGTDAGDGGPPVCATATAFCPSNGNCVSGCDNNNDCVEKTTCWTCGGAGTGQRRQVCSATACSAAGSGCKCAKATDCPDDEVCGAGGRCRPCDMGHKNQACGNGTSCIHCLGAGATYRCTNDPNNC